MVDGMRIATTLLLAIVAGACTAPVADLRPPLRVGTSGDYAPFSFRTSDAPDAIPEGLDIDVARRFARDTGRQLEFVRFRWADLLTDLAADRFDVAMGGVTMRPERTYAGTYTRPVVHAGAVLLVRRGLAERPEDVDRQGMRVAVNKGGHLERIARRLFSRAVVSTVDDNTHLPAALRAGDVDAIVCDEFEAARWRATEVPTARVLGPFTVDHKAYLAREPGLAAELDTWMRAREADGSLAELRAQWLGEDDAGHRNAFESDVDALLSFIDLRLAFMPAVAQAKLSAGRPVVDPTQEEQVLATAREDAAANGLEARSAVALFSALIQAARAIQAEYMTLPASRRPAVESVDLVRTLRPALAAVSRTIVRHAAEAAHDPRALDELPPRALARLLDPTLTPQDERNAIAEAVRLLRPATDRSTPTADR